MIRIAATWAADLLFPRSCSACEAPLPLGHPRALCAPCWSTLRMPGDLLCARCGIPVPSPPPICTACTIRPPSYDVARALGLYRSDPGNLNPLARAVRALKFHGDRAVATTLGTALASLAALPPDASIVPIPLHRDRLRERGYDQAILLGRALARATGLPLRRGALLRRRATATQTSLDARARRANLAGAFAAPGRHDGTTVVLVDDVLTTGATAEACADALRAAGAATVVVLTVGRTP